MTPDQALKDALAGRFLPVYLVVGEEEFLRNRLVKALREAASAGSIPGLNDDQFQAGEASIDQVIGVARTLPMMGRRRVVLVRGVERWDGRGGAEGASRSEKAGKTKAADPFERLGDYAGAPSPETVLILSGAKLDGRRRVMALARTQGFLVSCDPLSRAELPRWVERHAAELKGRLAPGVSDLIAELVGPELAPVADALERLTLFAGDREITEDDVSECLVRIRTKTVWELVDAVGRRDLGGALAALDQVYDPNDRVRLLGLLAWAARQLLRFESALRAGLAPVEAAKQAKAQPFKIREMTEQLRRLSRAELEAWLEILSRVDLAQKGGSRRPPKAILEHALIEVCALLPARSRREARGPNA